MVCDPLDMVERPTGTVTFLFTDIEGSTRRWEEHRVGMQVALEQHDVILRSAIESNGGYVFSTAGDAFAAAFTRAGDALEAAQNAQKALADASWPEGAEIRVRMGVHTGEAQERDGDYFGPAVNKAARIMSAGHGGQVLVSSVTAGVVGVDLIELGEHRLKDLGEPERILQLDVSNAAFPPLRTLSMVRNNLPVQRTPLVGRDADIARVLELLADSRLVTLTGIGGVGKTRLALAAAGAVESFADGAFFVDLTPLGSGEQVPASVADAIGLQGGGRVEDQVLEFLRLRRVLIILDNCEHLIDDVAEFVDKVLDRDGDSKLLVTSREDLEVDGERTLRVSSLRVDDDADGGPAVELLIGRAEAAGVELSRTGEQQHVLAQICKRLDGIPLAIELAAAQLAHLSPSDLQSRLDQRFDLLSGGRGRRRQRQQTLQAVMDWSWELLTPPEQALLARLAVFTGPWDLAASEAICIEVSDGSLTAALGSLVHKSLVQRLDDSMVGSSYRMLETVRLYAQQKLVERGEADQFRNRHLGFYANRIEQEGLDVHMLSMAHIAQYRRDNSNIRAAIDWALTTGQYEAAASLVIAGSVNNFSIPAANGAELIDIADLLLAQDISAVAKARLLAAQAWLFWAFKPEPAGVLEISDRAITAAREANDPFALAQALIFATFYRGDRATWDRNYPEATAAAAACGSTLVQELVNSFLVHSPQYQWSDHRLIVDQVRSYEPRHDLIGVGLLGSYSSMLGAALVVGDVELASWAADQYIAIHDRLALPLPWYSPFNRALVAAQQGDLTRAQSLMRAAHEIEQASRVGATRPDWLLLPAIFAANDGRYADCAALIEAIRSNPVPLSGGPNLALYFHLRNRVRDALDPEAIAAARVKGRTLDVDDTIASFLFAARSEHN